MNLRDQGWYGKQLHKDWRRLVMQRDNYLCQRCKEQGRITVAKIAHHIKPTNEYPELALDIDNGQALCFKCHEEIHERKTKKVKELPKVRIIKP